MASGKEIIEVVALLRQGLGSDEIVTRLNIAPPVVWGIKAHWRMGKYGDKFDVHGEQDESHSDNVNKKAKAIVFGFISQASHKGVVDDLPMLAADEFAGLLARLTSSSKQLRDEAKRRVRDLAASGECRISSLQNEVPAPPPKAGKTRYRRWLDADEKLLAREWEGAACARDSESVDRLSRLFERSPLAIIIRLHKLGLVTTEEGDVLCATANAPILLSERSDIAASGQNESRPAEGAVEVSGDTSGGDNLSDEASDRVCVECGRFIPAARIELIPTALRCAGCESMAEKSSDFHRYVDEGIAGSRDEHKKMRARDWGDMRKRGRE